MTKACGRVNIIQIKQPRETKNCDLVLNPPACFWKDGEIWCFPAKALEVTKVEAMLSCNAQLKTSSNIDVIQILSNSSNIANYDSNTPSLSSTIATDPFPSKMLLKCYPRRRVHCLSVYIKP